MTGLEKIDETNPVYNAGFIEGRKFEQERQEQRDLVEEDVKEITTQKRVGGMTVNIRVSEMDMYKQLAKVAYKLAEACETSDDPACKEALTHWEQYNDYMALHAQNRQAEEETEQL